MSENDQNPQPQHDPRSPPRYQYAHNRGPNGQAQTSGKAIASMVLGICSIVTCMMYGIPGIVCGILGIVFSKQAMAAIENGTAPHTSEGMAKAGKICGWIGLSLSLLMVLVMIIYIIVIIGVLGAAAAGAAPVLMP